MADLEPMHFDGMAGDYTAARPPYPADLWRDVFATGVVAPVAQRLRRCRSRRHALPPRGRTHRPEPRRRPLRRPGRPRSDGPEAGSYRLVHHRRDPSVPLDDRDDDRPGPRAVRHLQRLDRRRGRGGFPRRRRCRNRSEMSTRMRRFQGRTRRNVHVRHEPVARNLSISRFARRPYRTR